MKTALLVLDLINDIIHPNGKIAAAADLVNQYQVIDHANRVIAVARENNLPIVFVKVGFHAGYPECSETSPVFNRAKELGALQLNTWGTEFHEAVNITRDDVVITKHRISAFYATALEAILRANQIEDLLILGVSTDMAVQTTAREAHDRDYKVTIVSDACCASSLETHENTLKLLQKIATTIKSDDLIDHIAKKRTPS